MAERDGRGFSTSPGDVVGDGLYWSGFGSCPQGFPKVQEPRALRALQRLGGCSRGAEPWARQGREAAGAGEQDERPGCGVRLRSRGPTPGF